MAVAVRLMRTGKRNQPMYRIIAIDKRKKRDSRYIENLGFYNPLKEPAEIKINKDRLDDWIKKGAIVSEGLAKLLKYQRRLKRV